MNTSLVEVSGRIEAAGAAPPPSGRMSAPAPAALIALSQSRRDSGPVMVLKDGAKSGFLTPGRGRVVSPRHGRPRLGHHRPLFRPAAGHRLVGGPPQPRHHR